MLGAFSAAAIGAAMGISPAANAADADAADAATNAAVAGVSEEDRKVLACRIGQKEIEIPGAYLNECQTMPTRLFEGPSYVESCHPTAAPPLTHHPTAAPPPHRPPPHRPTPAPPPHHWPSGTAPSQSSSRT